MKKVVIHLSPSLGLWQACALIQQAKNSLIFLVLPAEGKLAESLEGAKLLNLAAGTNKLFLVSSSKRFRNRLRGLGLPYLPQVPEGAIEVAYQPPPESPRKVPSSTRSRLKSSRRWPKWRVLWRLTLLFGLGALLVLGAAWVALARAWVVVTLKTTPFEKEYQINLVAPESIATSAANLIKGQFIEAVETRSRSFPASGQKNLGSRSYGEVTLVSRSGQAVSLKAGTRLVNSRGLTFLLEEGLRLPPASLNRLGEIVPGSVKAKVVAWSGGSAGNLGPESFSIAGLGELGSLISARSSVGFQGGVDLLVSVVSAEDLEKAHRVLQEDLTPDLKDRLKRSNKGVPDDLLVTDIVESSSSRREGDEASDFDLKLTLRLWAIVPQGDALEQLLQELSQQDLPPGERLTAESLGALQLDVSSADFVQRTLAVKVLLRGQTVLRLNRDTLRKALRRKSVAWVEETVGRYPGVEEVQIRKFLLTGRMPLLSRNIVVVERY